MLVLIKQQHSRLKLKNEKICKFVKFYQLISASFFGSAAVPPPAWLTAELCPHFAGVAWNSTMEISILEVSGGSPHRQRGEEKAGFPCAAATAESTVLIVDTQFDSCSDVGVFKCIY